MSRDPAVLFYTSDFLSGTQFFSDEECGQYIRLLCQQHQLGHIPENHMNIICKSCDSNVWKKFIKDADGLWFNIRMEEEKEKRSKYCAGRGNNRKKGLSKKSYENHMMDHMSQHMENENENTKKDRSVRKGRSDCKVCGGRGEVLAQGSGKVKPCWECAKLGG